MWCGTCVRACMCVVCLCVCEHLFMCTLFDISSGVHILTMSIYVSAASDRKRMALLVTCLLLAIIFIVLVVVLAIRFKREYHNAAQQVEEPIIQIHIIPGDYTGLFLL